MRHATSNLNEEMRKWRSGLGISAQEDIKAEDMLQGYFNLILNPNHRDAVLSEQGIQDAHNQT